MLAEASDTGKAGRPIVTGDLGVGKEKIDILRAHFGSAGCHLT